MNDNQTNNTKIPNQQWKCEPITSEIVDFKNFPINANDSVYTYMYIHSIVLRYIHF